MRCSMDNSSLLFLAFKVLALFVHSFHNGNPHRSFVPFFLLAVLSRHSSYSQYSHTQWVGHFDPSLFASTRAFVGVVLVVLLLQCNGQFSHPNAPFSSIWCTSSVALCDSSSFLSPILLQYSVEAFRTVHRSFFAVHCLGRPVIGRSSILFLVKRVFPVGCSTCSTLAIFVLIDLLTFLIDSHTRPFKLLCLILAPPVYQVLPVGLLLRLGASFHSSWGSTVPFADPSLMINNGVCTVQRLAAACTQGL
jgi:hypothetical protein